jgi:hypothetical protein
VRDIEILNQLLKKYDLMLPVLPGEQRRIYRSKRKTLAVILGQHEKSRFMLKAAVRFYYMMRSLGMRATLASGARAAVFASVMAVMVVAGSSVLILQNYIYRQGVIAVNDTQQSGVISASSDLKIRRCGSEITSFKAPDVVAAGDEIITGDSSALFQFSNGAVVKVLGKSSVFIPSLGVNYRFDLRSGGMITRIPALAPGSGFAVYTPDSIVSVKGTEFGVLYDNGKTDVFVINGTVHVKHLSSGAEYDITAGTSTEVNENKRISPMNDDEAQLMKGFAELKYVEAIGTRSPEELQAVKDKLIASDSSDQTKKLTLAALKEKYGKLDEIILYSGRKYTGVIISRGGVYKILTPGGTVSVQAKEVKGSRIIQ